jgi:glycosyltransferase involved in cell wall biosynthesis
MPYVALEAMSAALPIAATASAGVESLVQDGVNGFIVPRDDPSAFAEALLKLLRDPRLRAACGHASAERVTRYTVDRMVQDTLRTYLGSVCRLEQDLSIYQEETEGAFV